MKKVLLDKDLVYDLSSLNEDVDFIISNNEVNLYLYNLKEDNEVLFNISNNAILHLSIFTSNNFKNSKITANVGKNSKIIVYFADFSVEQNKLNTTINLNDVNAICEWHLASLSSSIDIKNIDVNVFHNHHSTYAKVDNYGVCKDSAQLTFSGVSYILKGCHYSKSHQNAKIMVFDEHSIAKAKPVLKIDEYDIEASHSAGVGKISDEYIFYLTSRGLNLEEAKMLITLGYLKPILKGFDPSIQSEIDQLIERRVSRV